MREPVHGLGKPGHLWAAVIFALAAALELFPSLSGARMLSPESLLYGFPPFQAGQPSDTGPVNTLLSDVPTAFQPYAEYAHERFAKGQFPSWNPNVLLGTPFGANQQAQLLNPLQIPLRVLPLDWAYGFVAALKLWLAGFGAYLFARELRCSFWAGVVAGIAFLASSYMVVWLQWPHTAGFCFLPWVFCLIERIARGRLRWGPVLVLPVAMLFLAGHPGTYSQGLLLAAVYAVGRLALLRDVSARDRVVRCAAMVAAVALGALLAAPELLPGIVGRGESTGFAERKGAGLSLPGDSLLTLLFPDWWGRPNGAAVPGPINFNERTVYTGVATLALGLTAVSDRSRWRLWAPLLAVAVFGGLVAFAVDPFHAIVSAVPPFDNLNAARMLLGVNLAVAILAAMGTDALLAGRARRATIVAGAAGLLTCLIAAVLVGPNGPEVRATARHFVSGTDFASADVLALTSIAWAGLFALAVTAIAVVRPRMAPALVVAAVLMVVVVDSGKFLHGYNPQAPDSARPPEPPSLRYLSARIGGERATALGEVLPPDSAALYGIRDLRGHDPPDPPLRLIRFIDTGWSVPAQSRFALPADIDARGLRALDVLGVRWLLTAPTAPARPLPGLRRVYAGADAFVYRSSTSSGRAYVPTRVRSVGGEGSALEAIQSRGFVPGRDAAVERAARLPSGRGTVRVTRDDPEDVRLRAVMSRPGVVVLNDALRDGWSVHVDGRRAPPLRVNSVVRGVVVPAGTHEVRWSYRLPGLGRGRLLALLGAVGLVGWALIALRRRRVAGPPLAGGVRTRQAG